MELRDSYQFSDADGLRITRDGYMVASPRIARTGIQHYSAAEVGLTDRDPGERISVYRPPEEVFHKSAIASLAHRPVTDGHPPVMVDSQNWKTYAHGDTGDEVIRDGDYIRVPIKVMDQALISQIRDGKRELSVGYTCELEFIDGETPDGVKYDAIQRKIRANHLAVCSKARGGPALAITDERPANPVDKGGRKAMHTLTLDGLQVVEVSDSAKAAIEKLQTEKSKATETLVARDSTIAELTTKLADAQAAEVTLKAQLADAQLTPEKMRAAAAQFAKVLSDAKALAPKAVLTDSMGETEIKKAVVLVRVGDAAKDWTHAQVDTSFATLAAGVKSEQKDSLGAALSDGVAELGDAVDAARAKYISDLKAASQPAGNA